jgi:hypothetical protein
VIERRTITPTLIFNVEDAFARERLGGGSHPRPFEPLRFLLVARLTPGPREAYMPEKELAVTRNSSGYHIFFGEERLVGGSLRRLELLAGTYLIRVTGQLYQTLQRQVVVPMPNPNDVDPASPDPARRDPLSGYSFDLQPAASDPFPSSAQLRPELAAGCVEDPRASRQAPTLLRGSLHDRGGQPVVGARVQVERLSNIYETTESGDWVLWFSDANPIGLVTVRVDYPDGRRADVTNVCVTRWRATSLYETALRGRVTRRGTGVPGAAIAVSSSAQQSTCGSDGVWAYYFDFDQPTAVVDVTATLPSGERRTAPGVPVRSRATVRVPAIDFA